MSEMEICCSMFLIFCGLGDGAPFRSARLRDTPRRICPHVGGCGTIDLVGNNRADETAKLGRRRQDDGVTTANRVCMCVFRHRYLMVVSSIAINHDSGYGTALDPTVRSDRLRRLGCKKPLVNLLLLRGLVVWVGGDGLALLVCFLTTAEFDSWPCSTVLLVKFSSFLGFLALA